MQTILVAEPTSMQVDQELAAPLPQAEPAPAASKTKTPSPKKPSPTKSVTPVAPPSPVLADTVSVSSASTPEPEPVIISVPAEAGIEIGILTDDDDDEEPPVTAALPPVVDSAPIAVPEPPKMSFVQQEQLEDNTMRIPQYLQPLQFGLPSNSPKPSGLGRVTRTPVTRRAAALADSQESVGPTLVGNMCPRCSRKSSPLHRPQCCRWS